MTSKNKQVVSAQVVLKPAGGRDTSSQTSVTAENVHLHLPSAEDFHKAQSYFTDLGFDVQHGFGNSFSITGSMALFEKAFKTQLSETEKGGIKALRRDETKSVELPIDDLPKEMKKITTAITFSEPPDFGPTSF